MRIGKNISIYRHHFKLRPLPVTVDLFGKQEFAWRWILGIQIGSWFFGAINGSKASSDSASSSMSTKT